MANELYTALDDLLAFHDVKHPNHEALFEQYAEDCAADEVVPTADRLHGNLIRAAREALANARAEQVPA